MRKCGISFYNLGVGRNLLSRFWPLWAAYLVFLLLLLPASLSGVMHNVYLSSSEMLRSANVSVLNSAVTAALSGFVVCPLSAMAVYGYLFSGRSCGMMASLPVSRDTQFSTAFLTGLVPILLADVIAAAVCAAVWGPSGTVLFSTVMKWLLTVVLADVGFFGFAAFCAVLTGNRVIFPVVFVVLQCTAIVAELCVRSLLYIFVYGLCAGRILFQKLSPGVELYMNLKPVITESGAATEFGISDMPTLAVYAAAGLLFSAAALLLYRRRNMEYATDIVAFPVLKPIFKYCMSFGTSVVFSVGIYEWLCSGVFKGTSAVAAVLVLIWAGAALGWYLAEILIQKSLAVTECRWKGCLIICGVLTAAVLLLEFDAFGYEKYVPDPENVSRAEVATYSLSTFEDPEGIKLVTDVHRKITASKQVNDYAAETKTVTVTYYLKNGRTSVRMYRIACDDAAAGSDLSGILVVQSLINTPEAILSRFDIKPDITPADIDFVSLDSYLIDENSHYMGNSVRITAEQAAELFLEGILPDMAEGRIGNEWLYTGADYLDNVSSLSVAADIVYDGAEDSWVYIPVNMDSVHTLQWLRENTDIEAASLRDSGVK